LLYQLAYKIDRYAGRNTGKQRQSYFFVHFPGFNKVIAIGMPSCGQGMGSAQLPTNKRAAEFLATFSY
jgi:hypothetical protein